MGYPKQPGDDPQAHRELAARHLVALQELAALRQEVEKLKSERDNLANLVRRGSQTILEMEAVEECKRVLVAEAFDDIMGAISNEENLADLRVNEPYENGVRHSCMAISDAVYRVFGRGAYTRIPKSDMRVRNFPKQPKE